MFRKMHYMYKSFYIELIYDSFVIYYETIQFFCELTFDIKNILVCKPWWIYVYNKWYITEFHSQL